MVHIKKKKRELLKIIENKKTPRKIRVLNRKIHGLYSDGVQVQGKKIISPQLESHVSYPDMSST